MQGAALASLLGCLRQEGDNRAEHLVPALRLRVKGRAVAIGFRTNQIVLERGVDFMRRRALQMQSPAMGSRGFEVPPLTVASAGLSTPASELGYRKIHR